MANIKSQIKRNRQNEKRRVRNRAVRSEIHTRTKAAIAAAEAGEDSGQELATAIRRIDSAVSKGVLHKNTAARQKSRLVKRLRAIESGS
ncbi:MAG: 30S ribosomal protein S20 [Acidimicrobiales bacterium]|nr:30S ribosomal protein S20 [Acidimicrobiales bacterium]